MTGVQTCALPIFSLSLSLSPLWTPYSSLSPPPSLSLSLSLFPPFGHRTRLVPLPSATYSFSSTPCFSDPASLPTLLLFGQSVALSGPWAAYGAAVRAGILAAFQQRNAQGGVFGYRLGLHTMDDGGRPENCTANTKVSLLLSLSLSLSLFVLFVHTQAIRALPAVWEAGGGI